MRIKVIGLVIISILFESTASFAGKPTLASIGGVNLRSCDPISQGMWIFDILDVKDGFAVGGNYYGSIASGSKKWRTHIALMLEPKCDTGQHDGVTFATQKLAQVRKRLIARKIQFQTMNSEEGAFIIFVDPFGRTWGLWQPK